MPEITIAPSIGGIADAPPDVETFSQGEVIENFNPLSIGLRIRKGLRLYATIPDGIYRPKLHSYPGNYSRLFMTTLAVSGRGEPGNPFLVQNWLYDLDFLPGSAQMADKRDPNNDADRIRPGYRATVTGVASTTTKSDTSGPEIGNTGLYSTYKASSDTLTAKDGDKYFMVLSTAGNMQVANWKSNSMPATFTSVASMKNAADDSLVYMRDMETIKVFRKFMILVETDSTKIWFSDIANSIPSVNTQLGDLGTADIFSEGGKILFVDHYGTPTSSGFQDLLAIVTDEGEVALYDVPIDGLGSENLKLQGDYKLQGKPTGSYLRTGRDIHIHTSIGIESINQISNVGVPVPLSEVIQETWKAMIKKYPGEWELSRFVTSDDAFVFMYPIENNDGFTLIMNQQTGAFATYDIKIDSLVEHEGKIYILSDKNIYTLEGSRDEYIENNEIKSKPIVAKWLTRPKGLGSLYKKIANLVKVDYMSKIKVAYRVFATNDRQKSFPLIPQPLPDIKSSKLGEDFTLGSSTLVSKSPRLHTRNHKLRAFGTRLQFGMIMAIQNEEEMDVDISSLKVIYQNTGRF